MFGRHSHSIDSYFSICSLLWGDGVNWFVCSASSFYSLRFYVCVCLFVCFPLFVDLWFVVVVVVVVVIVVRGS